MSPWLPLLLVVIACGCSKSDRTDTEASSEARSKPAKEKAVPLSPPAKDAAPPQPHDREREPGPIPASARQLIVTVSEGWQGTRATLLRYEREPGGSWRPVATPFAAVLGQTGLAWGRGAHRSPAKTGEPQKREGDGKSPAGVFALGSAYGYAESFGGPTALPYQQVNRRWRCVNDSTSAHYNRVLDTAEVEKDWREAEKMRRRDELYRLVVPIDHNAILPGEQTPQAEAGSCIFLHVWRRPDSPTIGCTAMPLDKMTELITWLDPAAHPYLVALPRDRYQSLREAWRLPELSQL